MIEALYIHIPFCTSRCAYCDFATQACHDERAMDEYTDALSLQLRRASRAGLLGDIKTIYIGGGTPTHLGARRLGSLVYLISLSINLEQVEEFTVECNPESLTAEMVKDLYALGVSRFSMGAQSFDDEVLRRFGRAHNAEQIRAAANAAHIRDVDLSLDLICGAEGQTLQSWTDSVEAALECGVNHISIYPLIVEEGTPLGDRVEAGEWDGPDEDLQAEMMMAAEEMLVAAGMHRYEVASYAQPGHESKHNTAYWTGRPYLGLGAGASSMLAPEDYAACIEAGLFGDVIPMEDATLDVTDVRIRLAADADSAAFSASAGHPRMEGESLTRRQAMLEDTMLAFRRSAGLSAALSEGLCREIPELGEVLMDLQRRGLVQVDCEGAQVPTEQGWLMGNEIFGAIWDLADPQ